MPVTRQRDADGVNLERERLNSEDAMRRPGR
jgi:hypothetical protein